MVSVPETTTNASKEDRAACKHLASASHSAGPTRLLSKLNGIASFKLASAVSSGTWDRRDDNMVPGARPPPPLARPGAGGVISRYSPPVPGFIVG